jgi:hypothetical protein
MKELVHPLMQDEADKMTWLTGPIHFGRTGVEDLGVDLNRTQVFRDTSFRQIFTVNLK